MRDDNASLICDLTNPTCAPPTAVCCWPQDLLHLRRTRFLWEASALERLALHNFEPRSRRGCGSDRFASDFADLFEVRGSARGRRGARCTRRKSRRTA